MIVALKELSIRGDFRTTVEYFIRLSELEAFKENTITTGWLDSLISNKLTAEARCHIACHLRGCHQGVSRFRSLLGRIQAYSRQRPGPRAMFLKRSLVSILSTKILVTHLLPRDHRGRMDCVLQWWKDHGWCPSFDGWWTISPPRWKESLGILAGGSWCSQTHGRHQNVSHRAGKRPNAAEESKSWETKFFVDSGDHINAGEPYAEIEVRLVSTFQAHYLMFFLWF
jgi:hypothetical protein